LTWQAWQDKVGYVEERTDTAGVAWPGVERLGWTRLGKAGMATQGSVRRGANRQDKIRQGGHDSPNEPEILGQLKLGPAFRG